MARAPFLIDVDDAAGNAKSGASVLVKNRLGGATSTVYASETGIGTIANPLSTDANGRASGWLERGAYSVTVSGSGIVAYGFPLDAAPATDGAVDLAWLASAALPIGGMMPYGGSADPAGGFWLICDGRPLSRTLYSGLYSVIGTSFGAGDGSTTFNLPDTKGRTLVGAGQGAGLTARARGDKYGAETVTLTPGQVPVLQTIAGVVYLPAGPTGTGGPLAIPTSAGGNANYAAAQVNPTGGGGGHDNNQPSLVTNFVIRAR